MQPLQVGVLRCEAALAGRVDDQDNFAAVGIAQPDFLVGSQLANLEIESFRALVGTCIHGDSRNEQNEQ